MNDNVYDEFLKKQVAIPEEMKSFLQELEALCRKHNFSLAHDDPESCLRIELFKKENIEWLFCASKNYTYDKVPGTDIMLSPNYSGVDCSACGTYCKLCQYRDYCFSAWDKKAQERLISILSCKKCL